MDVAFLVYMHKLTVQRHVRSKHLLVYKPQQAAASSASQHRHYPELLRIHQHLIAVPVGELLINILQGELRLRHPTDIVVSLAVGLHAEVVGGQPRKSGDRSPDSAPTLPALLHAVWLPMRAMCLVGCCNFSPQVNYPLIVRNEGIIANSHPSLGQRDVLLIRPLPPYIVVISRLRRLTDHPFALAPLLLRCTPTPTYSPCIPGSVVISIDLFQQLL